MLPRRQSTEWWASIRLLDSAGLPVAGVLYNQISVTVDKEGNGTPVTLTIVEADWLERTQGALAGGGHYKLRLPASALDTVGDLAFAVKTSDGGARFDGLVYVAAHNADDLYTLIGNPSYGAVVSDIAQAIAFASSASVDAAAIKAKTNNLPSDPADQSLLMAAISSANAKPDVETLLKFHTNRRKKFRTGPNAYRTIVYDDDTTSPFHTMVMKDEDGNPTYDDVAELEPE